MGRDLMRWLVCLWWIGLAIACEVAAVGPAHTVGGIWPTISDSAVIGLLCFLPGAAATSGLTSQTTQDRILAATLTSVGISSVIVGLMVAFGVQFDEHLLIAGLPVATGLGVVVSQLRTARLPFPFGRAAAEIGFGLVGLFTVGGLVAMARLAVT
jgi:hypothetical protein